MVDDKLEREEAQRAANYEAIKSNVKSELGPEIATEARHASGADIAQVDDLADHMRQKAVNEVDATEREVERPRRRPHLAGDRLSVFYYLRTTRDTLAARANGRAL